MNTSAEKGETLRKERKGKVVLSFPVTNLDECRSPTQLAFVKEVYNYSQDCYNIDDNMICNHTKEHLKLKGN